MLTTLSFALKEWNIAVKALEKGQTILLLRKGGIKEISGQFQVNHNPVLLYPTYEHQKPHLLKSDYTAFVNPVPSGWHPETIEISSWANITNIFQVQDFSIIKQLYSYHIWTEKFVEERFNWKQRQPLFVLLLRVFLLPKPVIIPYDKTYGGCGSWIKLNNHISLAESYGAMDDNNYHQKLKEIRKIISSA
ncbi:MULTISPECIES: DUF1802 family protein [Crocosphaera]|uniref:DUF1802 family protein n=5 Tax=Crocosphaera watsonii TaxID=263511 RepID=T2JHQ6_CROWT|nr:MULTISPECIES: DUF1802 family protein [Crocosphaera]EHJ11263.1 hypothetical protein CWATWH0003_3972 [Crocosphaera watsonii WH 0003]MCH2244956.1 DUF1802 family protein [Crocosphaera sp.]NQZ60915.1 DUF1802 family protein [Crocosphaera sp.]CCQ50843.1 FIG00567415: hypothetical protein [Crocosphaera watsonii WH 8502]CCQ59028.1 hypothetical protein CWATWH0005_1238 [Crocosphaera watsonii WH 0005]